MTYYLMNEKNQMFSLASITGLKELDEWAISEGGPLMKKFAESNVIENIPSLREELLKTLTTKQMPATIRSTISYMVAKSLKSGTVGYVTDGVS